MCSIGAVLGLRLLGAGESEGGPLAELLSHIDEPIDDGTDDNVGARVVLMTSLTSKRSNSSCRRLLIGSNPRSLLASIKTSASRVSLYLCIEKRKRESASCTSSTDLISTTYCCGYTLIQSVLHRLIKCFLDLSHH